MRKPEQSEVSTTRFEAKSVDNVHAPKSASSIIAATSDTHITGLRFFLVLIDFVSLEGGTITMIAGDARAGGE
ncbi:hypothetical protein [Arthrobacter sp. 9MFCol3.1]|uniref:hypothetical protein n=1 Tax=Arthrobacter sp. 9MFCol3.1 TaxID=1150398 RepID=UPI0009DD552D|nr:hypothetical protein [Arthrobacter sp. 9MFCol3.1]